jgi:hypothetical protein
MATAAIADEMLACALDYAARGWQVFPVPPGAKKGYKKAEDHCGRRWGNTCDPSEIAADWARWPHANIGVACGPGSGLFVIEADTPEGHGVDGVGNLAALIARHGGLPETIEAVSPSGSRHLYFALPDGLEIRNSEGRIAPGVDVRGDGGMVIAPPSVRPGNEMPYRWLRPPGLDDLAQCPEWLLRLCLHKEKEAPRKEHATHRPIADDVDEQVLGWLYTRPNMLSRDDWVRLGFALKHHYGDRARDGWLSFSRRYTGEITPGEADRQWETSTPDGRVDLGTAIRLLGGFDPRERTFPRDRSASHCFDPETGEEPGVQLSDFHAFMPSHSYIFAPDGEQWPGVSVNARVPPVALFDEHGQPVLGNDGKPIRLKANVWLDQHRAVEQMTWAPGEPQIVTDRLISDGGWIVRAGCNVFNLYRPSAIVEGDPDLAQPWIEHVRRLYPDEVDHIIRWLAHRVQRPHEKINHALVLGGEQGIGKDTILEPVKAAVGPWNFAEVSPQQMLGRFNGYLKSVILRVSEARDLGDVDRFAFYEHTKTYTAAPPDVLRVDEKHVSEYSVLNVCGVIITTNHKGDGMFLPADDRRHFVAWSQCPRDPFPADYWNQLYDWYRSGGAAHVAAYLRALPLDDFDAKASPPKTAAFWDIVASNQAPEDAEFADALDSLRWPDVVTVSAIARVASEDFRSWLTDRRNSRRIPHRLDDCGYVAVRNRHAADGLFKVHGKRCAIYARKTLSPREALEAAERLAGR